MAIDTKTIDRLVPTVDGWLTIVAPPGISKQARTTRARILAAAIVCLHENPRITLAEIAAAAHVTHRQASTSFDGRPGLYDAAAECVTHAIAAVAERTAAADHAVALAGFTVAVWPLYRALTVLDEHAAMRRAVRQWRLRTARARVAELIRCGQQAGRFGRSVPAPALACMLEGLIVASIAAVASDELDADAGPTATAITALRALGLSLADAKRAVNQATTK